MTKKLTHFLRYQIGRFFKVLLGCLFICGCNYSDSTEELSGQYFFRNEGDHIKDIISHLPNRKNIYSEILSYDYNSDFIVAIQQPNYDQHKTEIGFELRDNLQKYPTNSIEERIQSETEADSILKNDSDYRSIFDHRINYWIIEHKNKKVCGPMTKEEYLRKRIVLEMPENIDVRAN